LDQLNGTDSAVIKGYNVLLVDQGDKRSLGLKVSPNHFLFSGHGLVTNGCFLPSISINGETLTFKLGRVSPGLDFCIYESETLGRPKDTNKSCSFDFGGDCVHELIPYEGNKLVVSSGEPNPYLCGF
jgi:hypothetical protein